MDKDLPTPPTVSGAIPIMGHLLEFRKDRGALLRRGYGEKGLIFTLKLGPQNVAVLLGPEYHKTFFTETDKSLNMAKPYKFLKAMFGDVAFTASHDTYVRQRPVLLEPFKRDKMVLYIDVMQYEVQRWLDSLDSSGELELTEQMNLLVQEVAGHALMGKEFNEQVGREFWDLYLDMAKGLDPILPPEWPLPKFRRRDRAKTKMRAMLKPIIAERRQHPEAYDDFLQDLITKPDNNGDPLNEEEIIGLLLGLMFAGHETTAGQGAWTIIQLLQNPEYLTLVQGELDENLPLGTTIDHRVLAKLPHIAWAVRETERMRPSADMQMRYAEQEIKVGGFSIPEGWQVQTGAEVAHFLPELFEDQGQYDPLRFGPDRKEDKQQRFSLIGFGGGTHKCPGMNFANTEMSIITAMLFQQFDIKLITKEPGINRGLGANRPTETLVSYRRKAIRETSSEEIAAVE